MNDRWPGELEEQLRNLPREENPPRELEERIAGQLRKMRSRPLPWQRSLIMAAVVGAAFFGLGFLAGRAPKAPSPATPQFALLVRESPETLRGTNLVEEYSNWAQSEARQGRLVGGEKLADRGRIVRAGSNVESNFLRTGELGGFFIVKAENIDAATRIAATCPHLKYGGTIEVRKIER